MATTTMHFGPEWMRKQPTPASRSSQTDFYPGSTTAISSLNPSAPTPLTSSYSASVTSGVVHSEKRDGSNPLRYSREEMIRIYQEGVNTTLGPEVERWDGIIREIGADPVGTKEMSDVEKRLFSGPLNSEMRRRQSTSDYLTPLSTAGLDRPKLSRDASSGTSPMRERFGSLLGARRRDSGDQPILGTPRKLSVSGIQQPLASPRDAAPPPRGRNGSGFDGILGSGESWNVRRRGSETRPRIGGSAARDSGGLGGQVDEISEMKLNDEADGVQGSDRPDKPAILDKAPITHSPPQRDQQDDGAIQRTDTSHAHSQNQLIDESGQEYLSNVPSPTMTSPQPTTTTQSHAPNVTGTADPGATEWSYLDTQGIVQGPFRADVMQAWHDQGYFTPDLLMKRTHIDTEWISVGELVRRAAGPKIFLSPIMVPVPPGPPGLTRRLENPSDPLLHQRGSSPFGAPHQPVPIRSLLTSTLDPYINGNSQSASPSSSAGPATHIFGNPEPPINAIGTSRRPYIDPSIDGLGRSPYSSTTATYGFNDIHRESILGHHLQSSVTNQLPYACSSPDQSSSGPVSYQPELSFSTSTAIGHSPFLPVTPPVQLHQNHLTNIAQPTSPSAPHLPAHNHTPSASPWGTPDLSLKRVGVFDPTYQSPRHVNALAQPQQPSPWERNVRTPWSTLPSEHSPDGWPTGDGTSNLTVSNLEQHNQQQLRPEPTLPVLPEAVSVATEPNLHAPEVPQHDVPAVPSPANTPPATQDEALKPPSTKPHKKSVSPAKATVSQLQPQPQVQQQPQPSLPSKPQATPSVSVHSPPVKTVWSKDDDGKKPSSVSIGFREIQEAEAKQSEVRKATLERERAATVTRNISTPTDDSPVPTTTSWGLPTSQVQTGRKEPVSTGSPTPAVPVWTNVVKPPATKKTMKEIQEEERRKKAGQQQTQEKEAINPAVRRSHAEAVSKTPTVTPGPAWTTVGANGKTSVISQHVRPTAAVSSPTPSLATRLPANGASPSPRSPAPVKAVVSTVKHEDAAANPSLDFLKWLTDSLKGLNQSVNLEDITSMLLSFPLDPDPTTVEIISDLIYANSTTLDGRRFAAEFVSKRKADATAKPKGNASANIPGKTQSIADVVKTQPKPAQSEWGFKVVNKKKKGGRS